MQLPSIEVIPSGKLVNVFRIGCLKLSEETHTENAQKLAEQVNLQTFKEIWMVSNFEINIKIILVFQIKFFL